ncbi:MAG TPA: 1-deoxy-D-xylulose-5-phosphate synthase, partial [Bacillota bacterium]|nr:1-deoxy-D-xylulose-5-phosphate synthase [Bacillota bacterium]
LRTEPLYFKMKGRIEAFLHRIPVIGGSMFRGAERLRDWMKYLLVPGVIFEELGFKYFGPINGHDIRKLEDVIKRAKSYNGYPVLIHVVTTKGKGYSIAENKPDIYHGISPFFIENGELKSKNSRKTYSEIFGDTMLKLADKDNKIVAVSAAMAEGTGLSAFASKYKDRFFDVGIAEQHAVTFCAGLASEGFRPVFAVYSTFLQRAYDQIIHDVCMQKLNVVFAIDRAGIVGSDGETHQGVFDITYLRHIPNIRIMSPKDGNELSEMLKMALSLEGPTAIRYPRGKAKKFEFAHAPLELGKSEVLTEGEDGVIISEGNMVSTALEVCEKLKKAGRNFTLVNARFIKPLDEELLVGLSKKHKLIYTLEDNVVSGGFGSSILELLSRLRADVDVRIIGFDDSFIPHGEKEELYSLKKIDSESVFNTIMKE